MEILEGTFYINGAELGKGTIEALNSCVDNLESYKNLLGIDSIELELESCYFDKKAFYKVMFTKKLRKIHNRWIHAKSIRQKKKQCKKYCQC
ncbi:hypothetical protein M0P65_07290 [Candidatus Gracilibacteria bacterium]|nr:hypothetical protein [Candidatus Gracilibacteria bacterium]